MPNTATLLAEIGSVLTRVTLTDVVAGEVRLIGQAEAPSTIEQPYEDATVGILQACVAMSETTGRRLLQTDGTLLIPQTVEGDGVDTLVVTTSASGPMSLVIAAVASDISAKSATHASRAVYSTILQTVTLNDTSATIVANNDHSWIERQVQRLLGLRPDAVILAGGLEDGAEDTLVRLAHIVSLTALSSRVDADGQARQDVTVRPVVFAGNSHSRERVIEALSSHAEPIIVENVRPSLEQENLDPTRMALVKLYNDRVLPRLPGIASLRQIMYGPLRTASDAASLVTRFLSEYYQRNTLTVDVGAANTAAYLFSQNRFSPAVLGGVGVGYGVGTILAERGVAAIMRWLPFPISERDLVHALLNKMLRPHTVPATREALMIEHALAREALTMAIETLADERPSAPYDMVVATGSVLSRVPHPGYAALMMLDALQPLAQERALDIYLDTLGLLNSTGALAFADATAAFSVLEHDMLRNVPLATCVVALGNGRFGDTAVEAELRTVDGAQQTITVKHGQIGRLELPVDKKAQLTLRPAHGVRIGQNAPGAVVPTGPADISGSVLGVIIDARGRPMRLPTTSIERQRLLWDWLVALGAETGPLPYEAAPPLPEVIVPEVATVIPEAREPEPVVQVQQTTTVAPEGIENDLAKLRQTVEAPKKRGLFGRK